MTTQSDAKLEANRQNAQKSTGPHNTLSTRYNALKHGLLSEGVTELDDAAGFGSFCAQLEADYKPASIPEKFLVQRIAICMVRLRRVIALEAEFVTGHLNPPITETRGGFDFDPASLLSGVIVVIDPGIPARVSAEGMENLVNTFQRYETSVENKLYRAMNQLERIQRIKRGENVPAPASADIAVHSSTPVASFGNPGNGEAA